MWCMHNKLWNYGIMEYNILRYGMRHVEGLSKQKGENKSTGFSEMFSDMARNVDKNCAEQVSGVMHVFVCCMP